MERKLDLNGKLDFSDIDLTAPNKVVEQISNQLSEETNGIIYGEVVPYGGHIFSYNTKGFAGLAASLGDVERHVDIQTTLGKQGEEYQKYEFYLHTPLRKQYKYRICYLQYGVGNYPVKVVLEQNIANDIYSEMNSNYIISCNNRSELEDLIFKIMYSKRIISVMQELIRINQIEREQKDEFISPEELAEENIIDID